MKPVLAIDLGGTKIEGAAIAVQGDSVVARGVLRVATERERGYVHILDRIEQVVRQVSLDQGVPVDRIGLSMPGSIDPGTGLAINSNTTVLNGRPLVADLRERLQAEIVAANDANCFALAEARFGSGRGFGKVFGVIMGTGVGGGWVIDGQVWNGAQGVAGEWGHSIIEPNGRPCWCGRSGCLEQYLSGPAVEADYARRSGENRSLAEIAGLSNPGSAETMGDFLGWFGVALGNLVNVMDPDAIVLGGGLSKLATLYEEGIREVERNVFHPRPRVRILAPKLGDSAGIYGAAVLAAT